MGDSGCCFACNCHCISSEHLDRETQALGLENCLSSVIAWGIHAWHDSQNLPWLSLTLAGNSECTESWVSLSRCSLEMQWQLHAKQHVDSASEPTFTMVLVLGVDFSEAVGSLNKVIHLRARHRAGTSDTKPFSIVNVGSEAESTCCFACNCHCISRR
jgi:hypothetical protein